MQIHASGGVDDTALNFVSVEKLEYAILDFSEVTSGLSYRE
jgi:hypothetical protein